MSTFLDSLLGLPLFAKRARATENGVNIDNALAQKQDDLGISASGDAGKFLNQQGQWIGASGTPYSNNPEMDGTASPGTSNQLSRGDHVHPTDTSREAVSNKDSSIPSSPVTGHYPSTGAVVNFVNSSIASATANFLGNFSLTDLGVTYDEDPDALNVAITAALNAKTWPSGFPTNNDYVYIEVKNPDTTGVDDRVERFKYTDLLASWGYEYTLNNSSFTAQEIAAIDSGITSGKVSGYDSHLSDSAIHVTSSDKSNWNGKQGALPTSGTPSTTYAINVSGNAATVNGRTVAVNVPSDAKFTDTTYESKSAVSGGTDVSLCTTGEKYTWNHKQDSISDLSTIRTQAGGAVRYDTAQSLNDTQKTQARSNIGAGTSSLTLGTSSTTAAAGNHTHTISIASSTSTSQIPLDANTKYSITAGGNSYVFTTPKDTTYSSKSEASGGTDVSLCTTGEKYTWNHKQDALSGQTAYSAKGSATKVPQITTNSLGQVTTISEVTISGVTPSSHSSTGTTYGVGTTANYGHVKLLHGDLNDRSYTDGVAAASAHTHSQYLTSRDISGKADKASITGATKCKITYNSQGIVTAGANLEASDIPNLAASKITSGTLDAARIPTSLPNVSIGGNAATASYATRASNYVTGGSIASWFDNLTSFSALGFRHWVFSSAGGSSFTPTTDGKMIENWDAGTTTTRRRVGVQTFFISNNTASDIWCDLRVKRKHAVTGQTVTHTFILKLFSYCHTPITIPLDTAHFSYEIYIFKNSTLATGNISIVQDSWLLTSVFENADG